MTISEILNIQDLTLYKVHLATSSDGVTDPLLEFWKDDFEEWQAYQAKKNFQRRYIISLIAYDYNEWLFAGVYESISVQRLETCYYYETELTEHGKSLIGRLIIHFNRYFRQSYLNFENYSGDLIVSEVLKLPSSIKRFPGYKNVSISFDLLKLIVEKNETSWKTALENARGIYLITDRSNGKLYVGKASSDSALWSRWAQYIANGHGGNQELIKLIQDEGIEYAKKNFQFSVLEVTEFNDDEINTRESYWKDVLRSREFGYNKN